MKRKFFSTTIVTALILSVFLSLQASAYQLSSYKPGSKTLYFGLHSTLPSAGTGAAISHGNWSGSDGLTAYYNFNTYSGSINPYDSYNSVGARVKDLEGAPSGWIAVTMKSSDAYTTFDIAINYNMSFGNGSSQSYYDYEGVFAHEFGHVFGLADLYITDPECLWETKYTVPTMYGTNSFDGTSNIYYYLRSVEADDISGKEAVANSIN